MQRGIMWALMLILCGCTTSPLEWNTDDLSDSLSIGNLTRTPVHNTADPPQIVGLRIEADVINVGYVSINVPFTITWSVTDGQDRTYAASKRFNGSLAAGGSWRVLLNLSFPARPSLDEFRDVVTFDLVE